LNGIFAVNKPPGISCTGLLDYFKRNIGRGIDAAPFSEHLEREESLRRSGKKIYRRKYPIDLRVGHGGTLDVEAGGVLVLGINKGCKLLHGYLAGGKSYLATGRLGVDTESFDAEGKITAVKECKHVTREMIEGAIPQFVGDIMQMPPIYSAIRMDGKRLYEYARKGDVVPDKIKPRRVTVDSIRLLHYINPLAEQHWGRRVMLPKAYRDYFTNGKYEWASSTGDLKEGMLLTPFVNQPDAPEFQLLIQSGGGVYVRSLIHDLGEKVGSAAAMVSLVRMTQGPLRL
ncbi:pseudouridine synthase, partial [Martensiomyces pterosporus]